VENIEFPYADELDAEMKNFETTWTQLEEFRKGMKEFEDEDWIIFRAKPYRFEEFLLSWEEKFRAQPSKSDFIIRVLRDIEGYKVRYYIKDNAKLLDCIQLLNITVECFVDHHSQPEISSWRHIF